MSFQLDILSYVHTNCFSIITLMIIQENIIKKIHILKDFGALRCRSKATLTDNKLVFL